MIHIRYETLADFPAIRYVNQRAFGRPQEAWLVDALRAAYRPTVSLVALADERVVGHVFFSPATLVGLQGETPIFALAPLAVLPHYQNQGVGAALVRRGLERCHAIGQDVVIVLGHSRYYPRFGFQTSTRFGVRCPYEDAPPEAFMLVELSPGALGGRIGVVQYPPEFEMVD